MRAPVWRLAGSWLRREFVACFHDLPTTVVQAEKNPRKAKRLSAELLLPVHMPVQLQLTEAHQELTRGVLWVPCSRGTGRSAPAIPPTASN